MPQVPLVIGETFGEDSGPCAQCLNWPIFFFCVLLLGFLTFSPNFFTSSSGKPVGSYAWTWSIAIFLANLRQKKFPL